MSLQFLITLLEVYCSENSIRSPFLRGFYLLILDNSRFVFPGTPYFKIASLWKEILYYFRKQFEFSYKWEKFNFRLSSASFTFLNYFSFTEGRKIILLNFFPSHCIYYITVFKFCQDIFLQN